MSQCLLKTFSQQNTFPSLNLYTINRIEHSQHINRYLEELRWVGPPPPPRIIPPCGAWHGGGNNRSFMVFFIMFCCILCVAYSIHVHTRMSAIEKKHKDFANDNAFRARICKRLRSPGIDSKESIPPALESIPGLLKKFINTGSTVGR